MAVPYTFAAATGSIPLSQLDTNFATSIVIGNTPVKLGDTITTLNNMTLANVIVTSVVFASGGSIANVTLTGTTTVTGNITVSGNSTVSGTGLFNGNLQFNGSGARIQGDFSNATYANRTALQDKTTNNNTDVYVLPNGTGVSAGISTFNKSDPANSSYGGISTNAFALNIYSSYTGTGSTLPIAFVINGTSVGSFDTSGRLLVGVGSGATISGVVNSVGYASRSGTTGSFSGNAWNLFWTGSAVQMWMDTGNLGTINITSDYRIKKNVVTQTANALDRVNAIRPVLYEIADIEMFKGDGTVREGFIAHELATVIPSAVDGVKDGLTSDGKIQPQTLRLDPIIAVLTKAVQELSARVAVLEAKP